MRLVVFDDGAPGGLDASLDVDEADDEIAGADNVLDGEPMELERCERLEELCDFARTAPWLEPRDARRIDPVLPFHRRRQVRQDPRDIATYSVAEAAKYLLLPAATLRDWVAGRDRVIRPAATTGHVLSFWNLVEAYVLASLRRSHGVPLQRVRKALRYVEKELDLQRPLIEQDFLTDGLDLFVQKYGALINASKQGQTEIRQLLEASLERVDRDPKGLASRLFPWSREPSEPRGVEIDPRRAFGKLVITGTGVPTAIIAERMRAGESIRHLARDYGLPADKIEDAVRWELGAQPH